MIDNVLIAYDKLPENANDYKGVILFNSQTGLISIYKQSKVIFQIYVDKWKNNSEDSQEEQHQEEQHQEEQHQEEQEEQHQEEQHQEEPVIIVPTEEYPCTDNAGKDKDPIELNYKKGDFDCDSLFVQNATIQEISNWCKCEFTANGLALKYTSLEDNPTDQKRVTYFEHKTSDELLTSGPNKGKRAMKSWIVTVTQEGNTGNYKIDKEDEPTGTLGNYLYSVGLISDLHICKSHDNWWDENDFKTAMDIFKADTNIKCIMSCGDISEAQTNEAAKHPNEACDADYKELTEIYDVNYWQVAGLRFFTPLGNHDYYGLFESRYGDNIAGKKNSECIVGYNSNVNTRIAELWPTGQQINGIVPGRGRIVFDLENGKSTANGQADMRFFSYNDYVDLYTAKGGYKGSSIWDPNKGGISDEAIKCAKQYVNNNWNTVKNNLVMWNDGGGHGRNGYSKLNYWLKKDNDIFIFLSVDYGDDNWGVTNTWHDRVIHARKIIDVTESSRNNDPYIKRMYEYVQGCGYTSADEPYNYQYYSPNTLIWLKEIIENNTDKKIFVFTHHFLPHKAGNSNGIPKNGAYRYSEISKNGVIDTRGNTDYNGKTANNGSNALTGIEFWFINKLNNTYKNVIFFSGHSHISWEVDGHFINHDYTIVNPSEQTTNVYTRSTNDENSVSGYTVSLPSLSKPRYINNKNESERRYEDAEIGIMDIYENGVKIKGYKIKKNNVNSYNANNPLVNKTIILLNN